MKLLAILFEEKNESQELKDLLVHEDEVNEGNVDGVAPPAKSSNTKRIFSY